MHNRSDIWGGCNQLQELVVDQGRVAGNQASAGLKAAAISGHAEVVEDLLSNPGCLGLIGMLCPTKLMPCYIVYQT